jgi:hypothetical protein
LSVSLPLDAYSGARYLHAREQITVSHPVLFAATFMTPNSLQYSAHPNVPMTRVETCVLVSVVSLASPKSATWGWGDQCERALTVSPRQVLIYSVKRLP